MNKPKPRPVVAQRTVPSLSVDMQKKLIDAIEWVDPKTLNFWKDNPRRNDDAAVKLSEIIKKHGFRSPLVVWRKNRTVYKGNTSLKAALILDIATVPVIFQDFPSEAAAKAYGIADNKSSEFSEWDEDILGELMEAQGIDGMGFTDKEKRGILMLPDLDKIEKINAKNTGLKDKIIVMVLDSAKKEEVKEMLRIWIQSQGLKGIEVR